MGTWLLPSILSFGLEAPQVPSYSSHLYPNPCRLWLNASLFLSPLQESAFLSAQVISFMTLRGKKEGKGIEKGTTRNNKDKKFHLPHMFCQGPELLSGVGFKFHSLRQNFLKKISNYSFSVLASGPSYQQCPSGLRPNTQDWPVPLELGHQPSSEAKANRRGKGHRWRNQRGISQLRRQHCFFKKSLVFKILLIQNVNS